VKKGPGLLIVLHCETLGRLAARTTDSGWPVEQSGAFHGPPVMGTVGGLYQPTFS